MNWFIFFKLFSVVEKKLNQSYPLAFQFTIEQSYNILNFETIIVYFRDYYRKGKGSSIYYVRREGEGGGGGGGGGRYLAGPGGG